MDDISFEFDSLRQSFNLKRNETFYSLTVTDGVQSSTILPENNIIVSLNGVIQEPGVGFEIVGSRINFSEIPRVGSTFVAFSYVGSEADVDAAEVVPPIEPGDLLSVQVKQKIVKLLLLNLPIHLSRLIILDLSLVRMLEQLLLSRVVTSKQFLLPQADLVIPLDQQSHSHLSTVFDGGQVRALVGVAGVEVQ